ncbi:unnamed protein product [Staurois parvus]|uniref:Uncharacterized protein n=1 Tax=Staurois parvus TaxID=386267 RepID=A0ABN9DGS0_9NEOB|nr:unnamed protein product [Staurois parvus]
MVAVQGRVAIYKLPPRTLLVRAPWERAAPRSGAAVSSGHSGTPIIGRDLCMRSQSCDH